MMFSELVITKVGGKLTWYSVDGRVYDVLYSADLVSPFTALNTDGITATPPQNTYSLVLPLADKGFYCLKATLVE